MARGESDRKLGGGTAVEEAQAAPPASGSPDLTEALAGSPATQTDEAPRVQPAFDADREGEITVITERGKQIVEEWTRINRELESRGLRTIGAPAVVRTVPMPSSYVVWLGPEPPAGVGLTLTARGRLQTFPSRAFEEMVDGDGRGAKRRISGTTHSGVTGPYIDAGYESIEFSQRCPSGHKYAGKLFATIRCPEHAAWLQITRGRDREGNPMFAFYLVPQFRSAYEDLKRANFRRESVRRNEIEDVMEHGQTAEM